MPRATEPAWECQPVVDPDPGVILTAGPEAVHVTDDPDLEDMPRSGRVGFTVGLYAHERTHAPDRGTIRGRLTRGRHAG